MQYKHLPGSVVAACILVISCLSVACTNKDVREQTARKAFDAWAKGEATGDYTEFKALIDPNFSQYSHPLEGSFKGNEAHKKLEELIAKREKMPNHLRFSEVSALSSTQELGFSFQSEGTVAGGFAYKGNNIIMFRMGNDKITGFSEYFGKVDPAWFK